MSALNSPDCSSKLQEQIRPPFYVVLPKIDHTKYNHGKTSTIKPKGFTLNGFKQICEQIIAF